MPQDNGPKDNEAMMATAGLIKRQTSDGLSDIAPARKLQRRNTKRQETPDPDEARRLARRG
jgi:hypothetical protein